MTAVSGNTFPVKDQIKALGGRWNPDQKAWMVPDAKAAEAQALVAGAPIQPRTASSSTSTYRPTKCKECGARADRYTKIYRSGICGGCYRDAREEEAMGY